MTTAPAVPLTVEDNGRRLLVTDPVHAEKLAGRIDRAEVGLRTYHPKPGVTWDDIGRALES